MLNVAVLNANLVMGVLFWENFAVLDGLNGGVVVVLMNLAVYNCLNILMLCASYSLVLNGGVDGLSMLAG
jgi:hypothetical protein